MLVIITNAYEKISAPIIPIFCASPSLYMQGELSFRLRNKINVKEMIGIFRHIHKFFTILYLSIFSHQCNLFGFLWHQREAIWEAYGMALISRRRCWNVYFVLVTSKNFQKTSAIQNNSITLLSVFIATITCNCFNFSAIRCDKPR